MSNVALDVAIGLVFIYLLYSLLATTIKETIASIFSYRGRMLERGIEKMLDGKNYRYFWWDKVANFFLWDLQSWRIPNINQVPFKNKKQELKKIDRKVFFSKTIINNTLTPKDGNYLKRAKLNKKAALFAAKITNHPLYKRAADDSWLFKKPAYLNSDTFSDILIDVLGEKKSTSENSPALMKDIANFVKSEDFKREHPDLTKILNVYIEQANGDLQRFKILIEHWYDDMMNRVTGWYKRQANFILLIIGVFLAIYGNVDTIKICNMLANDKDARDKLVDVALKSKDNYTTEIAAIRSVNAEKLDTAKGQSGKPDTILKTNTLLVLPPDQVKKTNEKLSNDINNASNVLGLGWYVKDSCIVEEKILDSLKQALYSNLSNNTDSSIKNSAERTIESQEKKVDDIHKQFRIPWNGYSIIGWLITAFAISLGAPFWFDLLNKFINLRVSGKKPEEAKKEGYSKTADLNQKISPNPKAFA